MHYTSLDQTMKKERSKEREAIIKEDGENSHSVPPEGLCGLKVQTAHSVYLGLLVLTVI